MATSSVSPYSSTLSSAAAKAVQSSSSSSSSSGSSASTDPLSGNPNENEFLTLLVAQLKNQDPLSPADSTQFVSQLAQFSSLEQLISINKNTTPAAAAASSTPTSTGSSGSSASGTTSGGTSSGTTSGTNSTGN